MTRRLFLIQGPPGTGKTYVATTLLRACGECSPEPALAVAASNAAADQLAERLAQLGLAVGRFGNQTKIAPEAKRRSTAVLAEQARGVSKDPVTSAQGSR